MPARPRVNEPRCLRACDHLLRIWRLATAGHDDDGTRLEGDADVGGAKPLIGDDRAVRRLEGQLDARAQLLGVALRRRP